MLRDDACMKQATLAAAADQGAEFERFRRPTRRDVFLQTMDTIVPWAELCEVIEPHYPKAGRGRPPIGLERMLRMYFVQHWFNLADEACEEALLDSTALRRFVGIDLGRERVPDGTTLLKFRRLLEDDKHKLGAALFTKVGEVLQSMGMKVGTGTIVDASLHQLRAVSGCDAGASADSYPGHDGGSLVRGARAARTHAGPVAQPLRAKAGMARCHWLPAGQADAACGTAVGLRHGGLAVSGAAAGLGSCR